MELPLKKISRVAYLCPNCKTEISVKIGAKGALRACPYCAAELQKADLSVFESLIEIASRAELIKGDIKLKWEEKDAS
ncbi:hypothetical protein [Thermodesulfovibrio sp.]|uniref:hypothetical protein n=1 Tax=Thermodesulfovibrio sp. TaxID=2067987 RepID=UPI00309FF1D5